MYRMKEVTVEVKGGDDGMGGEMGGGLGEWSRLKSVIGQGGGGGAAGVTAVAEVIAVARVTALAEVKDGREDVEVEGGERVVGGGRGVGAYVEAWGERE